jgi:translocator protein
MTSAPLTAALPAAPGDRFRQAAVVVSTLATIAVNGAANALPLNGQGTGEISDRFAVLVIPAGYVFAIWGVIYVGLLAYAIVQALPARAADPRLRSIGWAAVVANTLNATWMFAWHWELFPLSLALMVGLLATLVVIGERLGVGRAPTRGLDRWAVNVTWTVYLGWITVATITNAAVVLAAAGFDGAGLEPATWAAGVLGAGIAIGGWWLATRRAVAYGIVLAWAYLGIAVKEQATEIVAGTALLGAAAFAALVLGIAARRLREERDARAVRAAVAGDRDGVGRTDDPRGAGRDGDPRGAA